MPPTTRRGARNPLPPTTTMTEPQRLRGSAKWVEQDLHEHHDETSSSSESDDEGIPAVSPRKQQVQPHPTLSIRQSPTKRRLEADAGQLGSAKRRKINAPGRSGDGLRPPPRRSNGYPTSDLARNNAALPANSASSNGASSVRTTTEDDDFEVVDPAMLAMVNSSCGITRRTDSPDRQLQTEAQDAYDQHSDVSAIDLNDQEDPIKPQHLDESDPEDTDLSVQPNRNGLVATEETLEQGIQRHQSGQWKENVLFSHNHHQLKDLYDFPDSPENASSSHKPQVSKPQASPWMDEQKKRRQKLTSKLVPSPHKDQRLETPPGAGHIQSPTSIPARPIAEMRVVVDSEDQLPPVATLRLVQPLLEDVPEKIQSRTDTVSMDGKANAAETIAGHAMHTEGVGKSESEVATTDEQGDDYDAEEGGQQLQPICDDEEMDESSGLDEGNDESDSLDARFLRDVRKFKNSMHPRTQDGQDSGISDGEDGFAFFDLPISTCAVTIGLPSGTLSKAKTLMKRLGWSALTKNWETRLTENCAQTVPGKHLARCLLRMERLLLMTPPSPQIAAQNRFLSQHDGLLKHYLRTTGEAIDYILSERLSFTRHNSMNGDHDARQEMAKDLVRLVIPLTIRVLGKSWSLGGDTPNAGFTVSTVHIICRQIGWLEKLYEPLMVEFSPLNIASPKAEVRAREALRPILTNLCKLRNEAPRKLKEEDDNQKQAERIRQFQLRTQEEIKIERERESEERIKAIKDHNRKVAQAIRGRSSLSQVAPVEVNWREEEELSLCEYLQRAYDHNPPVLPRIQNICFKLGHGEQEIKHKSRALLMVMLSEAYPAKSRGHIRSTVEDLMRQWP
ncbi:hypothetical protein TruAng_010147 [Truncatella angustata]|nr:hypothetical protein TruAng_010147 [Truncatella angustata]